MPLSSGILPMGISSTGSTLHTMSLKCVEELFGIQFTGCIYHESLWSSGPQHPTWQKCLRGLLRCSGWSHYGSLEYRCLINKMIEMESFTLFIVPCYSIHWNYCSKIHWFMDCCTSRDVRRLMFHTGGAFHLRDCLEEIFGTVQLSTESLQLLTSRMAEITMDLNQPCLFFFTQLKELGSCFCEVQSITSLSLDSWLSLLSGISGLFTISGSSEASVRAFLLLVGSASPGLSRIGIATSAEGFTGGSFVGILAMAKIVIPTRLGTHLRRSPRYERCSHDSHSLSTKSSLVFLWKLIILLRGAFPRGML